MGGDGDRNHHQSPVPTCMHPSDAAGVQRMLLAARNITIEPAPLRCYVSLSTRGRRLRPVVGLLNTVERVYGLRSRSASLGFCDHEQVDVRTTGRAGTRAGRQTSRQAGRQAVGMHTYAHAHVCIRACAHTHTPRPPTHKHAHTHCEKACPSAHTPQPTHPGCVP